MRLSIVIPYYNRKELLFNVLMSINHFLKGDVEIIIVDDGSDNNNLVNFNFVDYKLIRLERSSSWRGACIAYNIGFKNATGDWIMINSSECVHMGDVIGYVFDNMTEDKYINFSTYMARQTNSFGGFDWTAPNVPERLLRVVSPLNYWWGTDARIGNFIPYCGVISRKSMDVLGGYDERFKDGIGYDDYDFVHRVKNLGLQMVAVDNPFVVHQWHKPTDYPNTKNLDLLKELNRKYPKRISVNVGA